MSSLLHTQYAQWSSQLAFGRSCLPLNDEVGLWERRVHALSQRQVSMFQSDNSPSSLYGFQVRIKEHSDPQPRNQSHQKRMGHIVILPNLNCCYVLGTLLCVYIHNYLYILSTTLWSRFLLFWFYIFSKVRLGSQVAKLRFENHDPCDSYFFLLCSHQRAISAFIRLSRMFLVFA